MRMLWLNCRISLKPKPTQEVSDWQQREILVWNRRKCELFANIIITDELLSSQATTVCRRMQNSSHCLNTLLPSVKSVQHSLSITGTTIFSYVVNIICLKNLLLIGVYFVTWCHIPCVIVIIIVFIHLLTFYVIVRAFTCTATFCCSI